MMGNYSSDQKNARFYGLKLSRTTDAAIIAKLDSVDSVQGYIKNLIKNDIAKEETVKNWFIVDNCLTAKGEIFTTPADSREQAYAEATAEWKHLGQHDQNIRDDFYIGQAETDEDGNVNFDTMTDIEYIKE